MLSSAANELEHKTNLEATQPSPNVGSMVQNNTRDEQPMPLKTRGLGKRYNDFWALQDLNLSIPSGEIYGLLGPNGAGKTTALRMMAGLLTPDTGHVWIDEQEPHLAPLHVKRYLGFLTGNTKLYQRLTPKELLKFFGDLQEMPAAKIQERIERVTEELGLHEFLNKPCGALSTGQTQRVNIARALLHDPAILILDEPTSGLDIISADFILQVIQRCRQQQKTVIFSTHILAEVEILCDRIGILHKGHLVAEGRLDELLEQTQTRSMAEAFLALLHIKRPSLHADKSDKSAFSQVSTANSDALQSTEER